MSGDILPSYSKPGRPYSTATRLGRVMKYRGYEEVFHFASEVNVSPRQLTEYLAGRDEIPMEVLVRMAKVLDVDDPMLLKEPSK